MQGVHSAGFCGIFHLQSLTISAFRASRAKVLLLLWLASASGGIAQEPAAPRPQKIQRASSESYEDILRKVKENDSGVVYREFRLAYAESAQYKPNADPEARKSMFAALSEKDFKKAAAVAETILKDRYVDIYGHQVASVAYRELGDRAKSSIHGSIARNLIQSIVESGDGNSAPTAMLLISEEEETIILQALSLKMVGQELMDEDGHTYDRVEAMEPGEGLVTLYFNLDVPIIKMRESIADIKE